MEYKVGIYGDLHLCSRKYGAHKDYPKESLEYLNKITELTEKLGLTHLIGLGDLTYGKFDSLDYRRSVENELLKQFRLVNGNHYELKGNHDKATNGMTEYEFYINRGLIKPATNLDLGFLKITMLNYLKSGKYTRDMMNIDTSSDYINLVVAHNYFIFKDVKLPKFGDGAIVLDKYSPMFGTDFLVCGHIHHQLNFYGNIESADGSEIRKCNVIYPGCMMRPAYREDLMDEKGQLVVFTVKENGELEFDIEEFDLWSLSDSFTVDIKAAQKQKKLEKEARVDISDVVKQLDSHERDLSDPEARINSMTGLDERYKAKAIQLLRSVQ